MVAPTAEDRVGAHEAAHAVVAVRLGLVVAPINIRCRSACTIDSPGTMVVARLVQRLAVRPNPAAREWLEALALYAAAGCAADAALGMKLGDVSHRGDIANLVQVARALGVGEFLTERSVQSWLAENVLVGGMLLLADDGAACERVRAELVRKGALTGDAVRELAVASDAARGRSLWQCSVEDARRPIIPRTDAAPQ